MKETEGYKRETLVRSRPHLPENLTSAPAARSLLDLSSAIDSWRHTDFVQRYGRRGRSPTGNLATLDCFTPTSANDPRAVLTSRSATTMQSNDADVFNLNATSQLHARSNANDVIDGLSQQTGSVISGNEENENQLPSSTDSVTDGVIQPNSNVSEFVEADVNTGTPHRRESVESHADCSSPTTALPLVQLVVDECDEADENVEQTMLETHELMTRESAAAVATGLDSCQDVAESISFASEEKTEPTVRRTSITKGHHKKSKSDPSGQRLDKLLLTALVQAHIEKQASSVTPDEPARSSLVAEETSSLDSIPERTPSDAHLQLHASAESSSADDVTPTDPRMTFQSEASSEQVTLKVEEVKNLKTPRRLRRPPFFGVSTLPKKSKPVQPIEPHPLKKHFTLNRSLSSASVGAERGGRLVKKLSTSTRSLTEGGFGKRKGLHGLFAPILKPKSPALTLSILEGPEETKASEKHQENKIHVSILYNVSICRRNES